MNNYIPTDETVEEASNPFPGRYQDCKMMRVGKNSKFENINGFVQKYFQDESNRFVIYQSVDGATDKAISCVEVFKQQYKSEVHQWTKIVFSKRVVLWKCMIDGPRDIRATIEVPVIFIVVSKDAFPEEYSCLSMQCSSDREIAFRDVEVSKRRKSERMKRGGKTGDNKWSKPSVDARKMETREREQLLRQIESTSISK